LGLGPQCAKVNAPAPGDGAQMTAISTALIASAETGRVNARMAQGPLDGVRIVEFAGIGPGPFCCMLLSDMGADVVRVDRKGGRPGFKNDIPSRGRRHVVLDLKDPND